MAATFKSVNSALSPDSAMDQIPTPSPSTPRPSTAPQVRHPPPQTANTDDAITPTKANFGNTALAAQKPLPSSPYPDAVSLPDPIELKTPLRGNSQHSRKSKDSDEMDMDDSDGETAGGDDPDGSDDDELDADGTPGKKKKSQRFYCTDYPPCNLSFTRSEHLARHIRKHTGERPFQCHCSRRFSRLDNLRQHAQTVHVNEDIPMDSLAATGTRFQRQIRTERVRPTSGRARSSTAGSIGAPVRGHSKSLSTSSITSIGSVGPVTTYSPQRDDARRRPPPLVMAADPRARLSLESYRGAADGSGQHPYRGHSPSDFSTPTSATFSTGQSSPRWGSGLASPTTSHSRSQSMYASGSRTPGRRLSVPSSGNPFQSPLGANMGRAIFGPGAMNTINTGPYSPSNAGSSLASPTSSTWSRRDSAASLAADEAWRRRTWHPDTRGEFHAVSSRLSNVITPSQYLLAPAPLPLANPATQQTNVRLPGIESFDPIPRQPDSPLRRAPSPMVVDSEPSHRAALAPTESGRDDRRSFVQWDGGLHRGLNRLEIAPSNNPARDSAGAWANEVHQAVQAQAEQVRLAAPTVRFDTAPQVLHIPPSQQDTGVPGTRGHHHTLSAPVIHTPRESKRHGWYHGPPMGPTNSIPEQPERGPRVERMVHPNLVNGFSGFSAQVPQTIHEQQPVQSDGRNGEGNRDPMTRLETLVAVATSENSAAAAY